MQLGHTAKIGIFQCFLFLFFFLCLFLFILLQRRKCLFPHQIKCCRYIMQEVGCIRYFLYIVGMIFEGLNKREIDKMEVDRSTTYPSACGGLSHSAEAMAYQGTWECKVPLLLYSYNSTDHCCTFLVAY